MTYQTDSSCGRGGFSAGHSPCCGPGLFDRRLGRDATDTPAPVSAPFLRLSISSRALSLSRAAPPPLPSDVTEESPAGDVTPSVRKPRPSGIHCPPSSARGRETFYDVFAPALRL
ncbi:hypothetical protein NQZ68_039218 [Dissostichus eleginoides]|nr:hypothetical protein NQZ68_041814 [Dissostichus eleginoides]KAI9540581.1 hypothetical protein NQZ68_039218 [Dissostichus eleginoides]